MARYLCLQMVDQTSRPVAREFQVPLEHAAEHHGATDLPWNPTEVRKRSKEALVEIVPRQDTGRNLYLCEGTIPHAYTPRLYIISILDWAPLVNQSASEGKRPASDHGGAAS